MECCKYGSQRLNLQSCIHSDNLQIDMEKEKVYRLPLRKVYPAILNKALRKGRSEEEFLQMIHWLTGYTKEEIEHSLERDVDDKIFFEEAPAWNPDSRFTKGVVYGIRGENIEDPIVRKTRHLEK